MKYMHAIKDREIYKKNSKTCEIIQNKLNTNNSQLLCL